MAATSGVSSSESSGANKRRFADITNLEINEIVKKNDAICFFIAQKLFFANQYVKKWNVTCIASGQ
jgi:hypothetical protein